MKHKLTVCILKYTGEYKNTGEEDDNSLKQYGFEWKEDDKKKDSEKVHPEETLRNFLQTNSLEDVEIDYRKDIDKSKAIIIFVKTKHLSDLLFYKALAKCKLRKNKKNVAYKPKPIIIISWKDIMTAENKDSLKNLNLDKRFKFLDASIWHWYVSLEKDFKGKLNFALKEIDRKHGKGLYDAFITKEFIEFQRRLMRNAFLSDVGNHGSAVVPFSFHSENEMKAKADETLTEISNDQLKWSFLLIDDYGATKLNSAGGDTTTKKKDVIQHLLEEGTAGLSEKIEVAESFSVAKAMMKNKSYDIIFLDYLFSRNPDSGKEYEAPKFATEFLKEIDKGVISQGKGPFGKYWIFPVSVFNEALLSKLQEEGISHIDAQWHMPRGADPVNTPQLFRYRLFEFLKLQSKQITFDKDDVYAFFAKNPIPKEKGEKTIPDGDGWARQIFGEFTQRFMNIEFLQPLSERHENAEVKNDESKSVLIESLKQSYKHKIHDFVLVEHFQRLLYHLAYDTGFGWRILWNEMMWLRNAYNNFRGEKEKKTEQLCRENFFKGKSQKELEKIYIEVKQKQTEKLCREEIEKHYKEEHQEKYSRIYIEQKQVEIKKTVKEVNAEELENICKQEKRKEIEKICKENKRQEFQKLYGESDDKIQTLFKDIEVYINSLSEKF